MSTENLLSADVVEMAFGLLIAGGCKAPAMYGTPKGMARGVEVYRRLLRDVSSDELLEAVASFLRSDELVSWPRPGILLKHLPSRRALELDDSDITWGQLLDAVARYGRDNPPGHRWQLSEDPIKNQKMLAGLKGCGGWLQLCNSRSSELVAHRAAYRASYRTTADIMRLERDTQALKQLAFNKTKQIEDRPQEG